MYFEITGFLWTSYFYLRCLVAHLIYPPCPYCGCKRVELENEEVHCHFVLKDDTIDPNPERIHYIFTCLGKDCGKQFYSPQFEIKEDEDMVAIIYLDGREIK